MPVFEYEALARSGKKVKGVIDADTAASARRKIRDQEMFPTGITETTAGVLETDEKKGFALGRVSYRDVAMMTRQLAVLLQAGMPVIESLSALLSETSKPRLKQAIYDVRDKVKAGKTLSDSLADHPRVFSKLYVNLVAAGEASGSLESVLFRLADMMERQAQLVAQIKAALAYPIFMVILAVGIIVFLMTFIVPRIKAIFERQQADLPAITEYVFGTCDFLAKYWWLVVFVILAVFGLWRLWISRPQGHLKWDKMKLRFPIYGPLHQKVVTARFARTLGTMLASGLTMLRAIDVVTSVIQNKYIEEQMKEVRSGIRRGRDLAVPLREAKLFPSLMINMVDLGQRSGELENMLLKVADTYEDDVRLSVQAMVSLLEPAIIVVMGMFVGTLVLAVLLPILNMSQNF
jgi:general secretion pathway protein F